MCWEQEFKEFQAKERQVAEEKAKHIATLEQELRTVRSWQLGRERRCLW